MLCIKGGYVLTQVSEGEVFLSLSYALGMCYNDPGSCFPHRKNWIRRFCTVSEIKYNVYEKLEVPYYDCILGCEKEVTLPNHTKEKITIKPYSIDGDNVILQNKGIDNGNYIFVIKPKLPSRSISTKISDKEKEYLTKIKKLY